VSLEASRVKRYQAKIVRDFDHTFAVTNVDRQNFLSANDELFSVNPNSLSEKVSVFPITVDTTILKPLVRQTGSLNILTLGSLHYPPNADGIRWFANEVFPMVRKQVPAASLTIVGKNPPPDLIRLASDNPEYIFVTGYVPHLDPYYERSSVVVVPVRAGSGMRVRILETFALGMPTVTTTVGLEGIDAIPGEDVLVADTADEFASAVIQLLLDPELQEKLAHRGRCLAESRYDVHVALKAIDHVFETLRQA
jgi:glycosyltransferase involved in cell wall biosynthesis